MKKVILILITVVMNQAFANVWIGNGGTGFLCEKKSKKEFRLLDLDEMTLPFANKLTKLEHAELAKQVFINLSRLAPALGEQYQKRAQSFESEIEFRADANLSFTGDTLHLSVPKNCEFKQVAIRRDQADSMTKTFVVDEDIWKLMDEKNRAALMIHEVIYEHLSKLGEKNSVKARKITGYLMSETAFQDKPEKFWKLMREMKLPIYR